MPREGGGVHGFTVLIRDVFFSLYLDRPNLTLLSHTYPLFSENGKSPAIFPLNIEWSLLTRLRKLIASQCIPNVAYLYS
jgi:hypothetical protein